MDSKYRLGIPEIDTQHADISAMVAALNEVIAAKDRCHLIGPTLKRLRQLLASHFDYEESFMAMVNYDGLHQHRKNHQGVLKLLDDYFSRPPAAADYAQLGKMMSEKVLGHVMGHDAHMTEAVRLYLSKLSPPDFSGDTLKP